MFYEDDYVKNETSRSGQAGSAKPLLTVEVNISQMPDLELGGPMAQPESSAVVSAGDYLNKLTGERVERECRDRLNSGCRNLVLDFGETEIVNSVGVSILLGVIDSAKGSGATVTLTGVNAPTIELFEMLGVTKHVDIT